MRTSVLSVDSVSLSRGEATSFFSTLSDKQLFIFFRILSVADTQFWTFSSTLSLSETQFSYDLSMVLLLLDSEQCAKFPNPNFLFNFFLSSSFSLSAFLASYCSDQEAMEDDVQTILSCRSESSKCK